MHAEAAPIKCDGRESAGRPTDSHIESVGRPTDSLTESVGKPADSLPSHFIGAASGLSEGRLHLTKEHPCPLFTGRASGLHGAIPHRAGMSMSKKFPSPLPSEDVPRSYRISHTNFRIFCCQLKNGVKISVASRKGRLHVTKKDI